MDNQSSPAEASERTRRRAYQPPAIVDFGDVEKLTQAVSSYV